MRLLWCTVTNVRLIVDSRKNSHNAAAKRDLTTLNRTEIQFSHHHIKNKTATPPICYLTEFELYNGGYYPHYIPLHKETARGLFRWPLTLLSALVLQYSPLSYLSTMAQYLHDMVWFGTHPKFLRICPVSSGSGDSYIGCSVILRGTSICPSNVH